MKLFNLIFALGLFCGAVFGHGRSEELTKLLNSPVPEWLSLASPIKVEASSKNFASLDKESFLPRSGGVTHSRNRVYIPAKNFVHEFPYKLQWRGNNEEAHGAFLSPDGTRLLTNSGKAPFFRLYDFENNQLEEVEILLPRITYDEGLKGFIYTWYWASDEVLIGYAEILDEQMHELVESRLYAFQLESQSLARLDLSALDLNPDDPPFVEVVSVGKDLSELILDVGGTRVLTKADLKSPHKILDEESSSKRSERAKPEKIQVRSSPATSSQKPLEKTSPEEGMAENKSSLPWIIAGVLLVGILALLFKVIKGNSKA